MDYLQEAQLNQASSEAKTSRVFWFIFFGVIFVILFAVVYLAFIVNHKNVSDTKLMEGVALEVGENDAVKFNLNEQEHGMKINFVGYDSVEVTISSDPISLTLKVNEVKEVDLDNDGFYDLRIKLVKILDGKATIAMQKIAEESCQERWERSTWFACSKGIQTRDCDDENSCGTTFYKPSEEKDCLEIEFVENHNAFGNTTNNYVNTSLNNSMNNTINNLANHSILANLTNNNLTISNSINVTLNYTLQNFSNLSYISEHLKFIFEKDYVQTWEDFDIAYSLSYIPENAQLLLYEYKKGNIRKVFGVASEITNSLSVMHFNPFVDGEGYFETDFFYEPGTYIYEVEMFYCSNINSLETYNCNTDLSVSDSIKQLSKLEPDESIYKEIIVSGDSIGYECNYNEDCNKACIGCEDGLQQCIYKLCQDCFLSFDCREGYTCEKRSCVLISSSDNTILNSDGELST